MSTKCRTCDKVCSYRTGDYVPEYAALLARVARMEGVIRMLISCVEDACVLAFDDELDAARASLEEK